MESKVKKKRGKPKNWLKVIHPETFHSFSKFTIIFMGFFFTALQCAAESEWEFSANKQIIFNTEFEPFFFTFCAAGSFFFIR